MIPYPGYSDPGRYKIRRADMGTSNPTYRWLPPCLSLGLCERGEKRVKEPVHLLVKSFPKFLL